MEQRSQAAPWWRFSRIRRLLGQLKTVYSELTRPGVWARPYCPHCGGVRCIGVCQMITSDSAKEQPGDKRDKRGNGQGRARQPGP